MVKQHYFADKNYILLYIHNFFNKIFHSLVLLTGVYFLEIGLPLYFILLYYGLEWGLRGVLCPVGLKVFNQLGPLRTILLSNLFQIIFFILMSFISKNHLVAIVALCFFAMGGALFNPFKNVIEVIYITDDSHRGKQLSLSYALTAIAGVIGVLVGAYLIANHGYLAVTVLATIMVLLSTAPFLFMQGKPIKLADYKIKTGYQFILSDKFRDFLLPLFAEQLRIVMSVVFVPLFIFTIVADMEKYSYLAAAAIMVEIIFTLFIGSKTDSKGSCYTLKRTFYYNFATSAFLGSFVVNPLTAFFADSLNKVSFSTYSIAMRAGMHRLISKRNKGDIMLFGLGYQMTLCLAELFTLVILAMLTYFIGNSIFYIGFALGAVGCYMSWRFFAKQEKE